MNRFCLVVFSGSVLAACGAADFIVQVPNKTTCQVLSEEVVPVTNDEQGSPFILFGHERIAVDCSGISDDGQCPTELNVTRCGDDNGRVSVDYDRANAAPSRNSIGSVGQTQP